MYLLSLKTCLFWISHISGNKQYVALCDWLLPPRIMFSAFIHEPFKGCIIYQHFFLFYCQMIFHYIYTPLYTSVDQLMDIWPISIFLLLWIMLLWTFMFKFLCKHIFSTLLGIYLWVELLGHIATLCLIFWRFAKLFSRAAVPFYIVDPYKETQHSKDISGFFVINVVPHWMFYILKQCLTSLYYPMVLLCLYFSKLISHSYPSSCEWSSLILGCIYILTSIWHSFTVMKNPHSNFPPKFVLSSKLKWLWYKKISTKIPPGFKIQNFPCNCITVTV